MLAEPRDGPAGEVVAVFCVGAERHLATRADVEGGQAVLQHDGSCRHVGGDALHPAGCPEVAGGDGQLVGRDLHEVRLHAHRIVRHTEVQAVGGRNGAVKPSDRPGRETVALFGHGGQQDIAALRDVEARQAVLQRL